MSLLFFFKQETAYELRISDWSSYVCSSDLDHIVEQVAFVADDDKLARIASQEAFQPHRRLQVEVVGRLVEQQQVGVREEQRRKRDAHLPPAREAVERLCLRSEEHTSELQSLMRISYAVFCLQQKTNTKR